MQTVISIFLAGLLMTVSPCQFSSNISAVAFLSRDVQNKKKALLNNGLYIIGRASVYLIITIIIYTGAANINLHELSEKILAPLFIVAGILMLDIIKIKGLHNSKFVEKINGKSFLGSFLFGIVLALSFCPHSLGIFLGVFIPIVLKNEMPLLSPIFFALGSSLPVIIFSIIIVFSANKLGIVFNAVKKIEKWVRRIAGLIMLGAGLYYLILEII